MQSSTVYVKQQSSSTLVLTMDEDRLFQKEDCCFQSSRKWKETELSNQKGGRIGGIGTGRERSPPSCQHTARHWSSYPEHSAIIPRNQRMDSEVHETEQPLFTSKDLYYTETQCCPWREDGNFPAVCLRYQEAVKLSRQHDYQRGWDPCTLTWPPPRQSTSQEQKQFRSDPLVLISDSWQLSLLQLHVDKCSHLW